MTVQSAQECFLSVQGLTRGMEFAYCRGNIKEEARMSEMDLARKEINRIDEEMAELTAIDRDERFADY